MKKSKLLAFAVVAVMLITAMCASAFAGEVFDSGTCGDNLTWTLDSDGTLTISGTGEMTSNPWKDDHKEDIKSVIISDGVTTIGKFAFECCTSLSSVTIPNSVTTISDYAFSTCESLTSVTIPDSVTSIRHGAFYKCTSLSSVTIPDSVTTIGQDAFFICESLTSITIPESVTKIDLNAFRCCTLLTKIQVDLNNPNYSSDDEGVLFNKDKSTLIQAPGAITEYSIPDSVTKIGTDAFSYCKSLKSVTIPDSVTIIGFYAFECCTSLSNVTIPNTVTTIGDNAFMSCTSLTGIKVDNNNPNYSSDDEGVLFNKDKSTLIQAPGAITEYSIPDSVTTIGYDAFSYCNSLSTIVFKDNCPAINDSAFQDVTATAYYPANNPTWTEDKLQDYGGHITWMPYDPAPADIIADTVTVYSGESETADVDIIYIGEGEISSVRLTIDSALPIASVTSDYCIEYNADENCALIWKDEGESFGNGIIMTVHFDLNAEPAPDDGEYDVNLVIEDVTDADGETIELTAQSGKVIIKHRAGDVNLDGMVDNRDVVMIARYLVRITKFDEKQLALADYNGDGQVSNSDLVMVCRSLVGLD